MEFDLKEHNQQLKDTAKEVAKIRVQQREAQAKMDKIEKELLEKWTKEKESRQDIHGYGGRALAW